MGSLSVNAIELAELSARGKRNSDSVVAQHAEMEFFQQKQKPKEADSRGYLSFSLERSQVEYVAARTAVFSGLGFILSAVLGGPAGLTLALMVLSVTAALAVLATAECEVDLSKEPNKGELSSESNLGMRSF